MTAERCVFCEIIAGTAPAAVVHETERTITVVDPRQAHPGHVLVIPKQHVENVYALPDEIAAELMQTVVRISRAVRDAFSPDGLSLWQSNGPGAHQEVPHLHIHVHPRWKGDTILRVYSGTVDKPPVNVLQDRADLIRTHLG